MCNDYCNSGKFWCKPVQPRASRRIPQTAGTSFSLTLGTVKSEAERQQALARLLQQSGMKRYKTHRRRTYSRRCFAYRTGFVAILAGWLHACQHVKFVTHIDDLLFLFTVLLSQCQICSLPAFGSASSFNSSTVTQSYYFRYPCCRVFYQSPCRLMTIVGFA
jgi:hypothetical protein